nr:MAG TPA_asm: hypothetical protein [Caudoviricetes sp.]
MCTIKCPRFIHNSQILRIKIVDKDSRKQQLINHCCGDYKKCNLCSK